MRPRIQPGLVIELYLLYWRTRLRLRLSCCTNVWLVATILVGIDFYPEMLRILKGFHPNDETMRLNKTCIYTKWKPEKKLIDLFGGTYTYTPWRCADDFIFVCHLSTDQLDRTLGTH